MYGKVHLWAYVIQDLFCINRAENGNCPSTFGGGLSYQISTNLCKDVSDTWKVHVRASVNQALLWTDIAGIWKCPQV
jgi:hypothetical protein